MLFFTRIHLPRFSLTDYEKAIQAKLLNEDTLQWETARYDALLALKKHAAKMAASLHQLRGISNSEAIRLLNDNIVGAMNAAINDNRFNPALYMDSINNPFSLLKSQLEEEKMNKVFSGLCIITNSIAAATGALGVVLFGAAVASGPLGLALLGLGMAILSALVLTVAVYSIYVDGRNLFDSQLKEIEEGIQFLNTYPNLQPSLSKSSNIAQYPSIGVREDPDTGETTLTYNTQQRSWL
ncbi:MULTISPECIES: hypothetical protein [unclassified Legionella]|uniref:hypothetical protein n=1 Tax=unclassified Legionella TaxID=2622702 RepID=UPI001054FD0E|nr:MULTISPECIES: hypothetical protein [unclassified Legionella]MDI9819867.1 hypothetical protein [Legionella sp. PL877]